MAIHSIEQGSRLAVPPLLQQFCDRVDTLTHKTQKPLFSTTTTKSHKKREELTNTKSHESISSLDTFRPSNNDYGRLQVSKSSKAAPTPLFSTLLQQIS